MATLNERLHRIKENFLKQAPESAVAAISRSTHELRESGLLAGMPPVGSELPSFELPDQDGHPTRSEDLIERGPLVISFYRGLW